MIVMEEMRSAVENEMKWVDSNEAALFLRFSYVNSAVGRKAQKQKPDQAQ
jgi:hypothetical protein